MFLSIIIPVLFALSFPLALIWAAASDIYRMKITNRLCLILAGCFFPCALLLGFDLALVGQHFLVGLAGLALGILFFALRVMGGGDAKLIAATCLWLGLESVLSFLLNMAIFGGILTILIIVVRQSLAFKLTVQPDFVPPWLLQHLKPKGGIPYGVAIAIAGLVSVPQSAVFIKLMHIIGLSSLF